MKTILVTGANGQVGSELKHIAVNYQQYHFLFTTKQDLQITDFQSVQSYFKNKQIDYCINCAAYTAVDKAEIEKELAFSINADAVANLSKVCKETGTRFLHISTDYVFDGHHTTPYKESDTTAPINVYGASKLKGEELALKNNPTTIIIRTSWVYSSYGNNFVKTMVRLMKEKETINVVNDQFGCPTYAADLAISLLAIIKKCDENYTGEMKVYNFCNSGVVSWYEFAQTIKEITESRCAIKPIAAVEYPTPAKRPYYSVLDTTKIKTDFSISISNWKDSLLRCLLLINK